MASPSNNQWPAWSGLFPKGDFEWTIRMRLEEPENFYRPADKNGNLLEQRKKLIAEFPERHLVVSEEASGHFSDLIKLLKIWGIELKGVIDYQALASSIEPDFLLMEKGSQRMLAASVCFPSSWSPAEWVGEPLTKIHDVVPQLNTKIGSMIDRFLTQLKPGKSYRRANWSFTRSSELNYHPELKRAPLDAGTPIDEVYLRLEHQIFSALPDAILMGIRIEPVHLLSLRNYPDLWANILEKVETMPEEIARYKNLHRGKSILAEQMRNSPVA